ncbi:MAG: hypothetical protein ACREFL_06670 [Stellaceae bacterium]
MRLRHSGIRRRRRSRRTWLYSDEMERRAKRRARWTRGLWIALAVLGLVAAPLAEAHPAEPYDIHAIATITGPSAFVGQYMKLNFAAFEDWANAAGGIYDFTKYPERGLSHDTSALVRYALTGPDGADWEWISEIGGTPLKD